MTTACWSAKHSQLGADAQIGMGQTAGKIFPVGNGAYLTGAGYYDDIVEVAMWLVDGGKDKNKPVLAERGEDDKDTQFILVEADGSAYWFTCPFLRKVLINDEFYAVGSGAIPVLAALEAGASMEKAFKIAAKWDPYTGVKRTIVTIKPTE